MMLERRDRKFNPGHTPDLLCPKTSSIDDVFASDCPFIGNDAPAICGLFQGFHFCMLKIRCTAFLGCGRISMNRACGIKIAFTVSPHTAKQTFGGHNRVKFTRFFRSHEPAIFNADRLEDTIGRLQPFPTVRCACHGQTTCHMQVDMLPAFFFNFLQKVNRISLKRCNIRVSIQGMNTASRMPA